MTPGHDETFLPDIAPCAHEPRRQPSLFLGQPPASTENLAVRTALGSTPFTARRIPATTNCCYIARQFTRQAMLRWSLADISDDAVQIASELVANAVRHGRSRASARDSTQGAVWLGLALRPQTLLCIVRDPSRRRPVLAPPPPLGERHRGLPIVKALSSTWGWTTDGQAPGKTVWARVALPAA
ncbi:ATP-binding protein [Streptomyces sp. NPDC051913]|uniref:ATP-binding protein n=1 Tax=Streptomyces sp. NPDC051913 TaxID=3365676 RepID=UPI0037D3D290